MMPSKIPVREVRVKLIGPQLQRLKNRIHKVL